MGKSDKEQTKKRAHKAIGNSKHKATDGDSKNKKQSTLDALGSSPFETAYEVTDDGGARHSRWCELFRQLCEYEVQFGDCLVPKWYSVNPPSSDGGFRLSALDTGRTRKKNQLR